MRVDWHEESTLNPTRSFLKVGIKADVAVVTHSSAAKILVAACVAR